MKPITYTLTPTACTSETYYHKVDELAKEVVETTSAFFRPITATYYRHTSVDQIYLELLLLGVYARRDLPADEYPTMVHLNHILDCLEKSNNHTYQIERLRKWQMFLNDQPSPVRDDYWDLICDAADWFDKRSLEVLGPYTKQVDHFLSTYESKNSHEDDFMFHTSPKIEYHINMVGAEILNRVLRDRFFSTEKRLVVVPGCLRSNPKHCQASQWTLGLRCKHCTAGCQISKMTNLGIKHHFQVSFVVHQSALVSHVKGLEALGCKEDVGILGIACVLSLLEGGYLLESHQVPAQCVPLDYCGCINNWRQEGITTHVSVERLLDRVSCSQIPSTVVSSDK